MAKLIVAALLLACVCMALGQTFDDKDCQQPNAQVYYYGQDCTCLEQTRTQQVRKSYYVWETETYPVTRWSCVTRTAAPAPTSAAPA